VAGTTVGAGILALPAVTLPSGVVPSTIMLIAVWLYALTSGLLIAEVNVNAMHRLGRPGVGLLAMIEGILGKVGARVAGSAYLFLHYALLVAYMSQGGEILVSAFETAGGIPHVLPSWVGTVAFAILFGGILYFGHDRLIEKLNNVFVAIVIISFVGLILLGITKVNPTQFLSQDWRAIGPAISVMFVALFYHNIIPVVTTQLEGDVHKIRRAIAIGSIIPLVMFLAWNAVILGSVGSDIVQGTTESGSVFDPLHVLRNGQAGVWLGVLVSVFSEFAIVTSFIGFVYGLLDFLKDALDVAPHDTSQRLPLYSLVLLPSTSLSVLNPAIFFAALDYAGTFSISVLGGIIPAMMAWKQRYHQQQDSNSAIAPLIPGGKVTLVVMIGVAFAVMAKHAIAID
ncbi:MAG TPA: aromatic amino acid transport family protein, partial [Allocoleopsis sp.]